MGVQLPRKAGPARRDDRIILYGVASLPIERVSEEDRKKHLTAEPVRAESAPGKAKSFPVYEIIGNRILIPKYTFFREFWKPDDVIEFNWEEPEKYAHNFQGQLYPEQMKGAEKIIKLLGKKRGAIGKGRCGTGKTVIGTYLMSRIPGKHMVIVDQTQIAEQWVSECLTHLEKPSISFIMPMDKQRKICKKYGLDAKGRTKVDASGHIIIASAQTLMREPKELTIPVVMLIVDEAHSFSAPTFAKCIFRVGFKYSVALTATDERPDGLSWVFKDILGNGIVALAGKRMDPVVVTVPVALDKAIKPGHHKMFWCNRYGMMRTFWSCKVCDQIAYCSSVQASLNAKIKKIAYYEIWKRLTEDDAYNTAVVRVIRDLHKAGRNILVLSKFKEHLRLLQAMTLKSGVPAKDTSLYFGGMDKDKCLPYPITFATFGIAYKALNAPTKDAEVLAMPIGEVEQPAGRVERKVAGKKRPIIVDFRIKGADMLLGMLRKRLNFYKGAGYDFSDSVADALDLG